ncbi:MAG: HIT family protein [Ruminococcaceae bacterium]|nr:HIT family protein [Oscillospiraceae bacterium]
MENCFYCEKTEKLDSLMIPVIELQYSNVYLNRDQKHKGRCIVALKEHKTEYFQMTAEQNAGYFAEVSLTAQIIQNIYHPDKINYATFGDMVPHVHVHLVPKYQDGLQWGEAFHDDVPKETLTDMDYQKIVEKLQTEFARCLE